MPPSRAACTPRSGFPPSSPGTTRVATTFAPTTIAVDVGSLVLSPPTQASVRRRRADGRGCKTHVDLSAVRRHDGRTFGGGHGCAVVTELSEIESGPDRGHRVERPPAQMPTGT